MYAYLSEVAGFAFDFVFAEPVLGLGVVEDAAAVGVDVGAVVVGPEFAGVEHVAGRSGGHGLGLVARVAN